MSDEALINRALSICHNLTYNEEPQASAKMVIRELCSRLDKRNFELGNKSFLGIETSKAIKNNEY